MEIFYSDYRKKSGPAIKSFLKRFMKGRNIVLQRKNLKRLKVVGSFKGSLDMYFLFRDSKNYWNKIYIFLRDST